MKYFDNAATTKISDVALRTYVDVSRTLWGNPSSVHEAGRQARERVESDRQAIARCLNVKPEEIFFTSCATESNAIVFESLLWARTPGHVIVPAIEHAAVTGYVTLLRQKGWNVTMIDAPKGYVDPADVQKALRPDTRLVCCMLVNNVTGTIQKVNDIVHIVRAAEHASGRPVHIHTDATQALGKIPFDLRYLGVDSAAFSAHKIHGPKGVGFLWNKDGALTALSRGGGQERALRPGTENVPGIAAMAAAVQEAYKNFDRNDAHARKLSRIVRESLGDNPHVTFLTPENGSSPYILSFSNDKLPSEVFMRFLAQKGFCVSAGSACSNNAKAEASAVLGAMRYSPDLVKGAVRISFSGDSSEEDTRALCTAIGEILGGNV